MVKLIEFDESERKNYHVPLNKIACALAKLLHSLKKYIVNDTGMSVDEQLNILKKLKSGYQTQRGTIEQALVSGETKWQEYCTKTGQILPRKANRANIPKKLDNATMTTRAGMTKKPLRR